MRALAAQTGRASSGASSKLLREPRPTNVPLLRASWPLLDGIWGVLKCSWGVAGSCWCAFLCVCVCARRLC